MVDASQFPEVPDVELHEIIGRGGFATVYRGHQAAFNRHVAVKVLDRSELDADARHRFDRECQVMGALSNHPYIVTLYVAGYTEDERPYIVMPFYGDGTLADRIGRTGPIPWKEVVSSGVLLAGALETAHRADVLHRDIKPANVLRAEYGDVLGDFGIARIAGGHETKSGLITASIAHAPPEVLEGEAPEATADIYSLGSTLYECVAGRPAFAGPADSFGYGSIIRRILTDEPPSIPAGVAPPVVTEIIERALSKEKADRYQTALEFGEALRTAEAELSLPTTAMFVTGATAEAIDDPTESSGGPAEPSENVGATIVFDSAASDPSPSPEPVVAPPSSPPRAPTTPESVVPPTPASVVPPTPQTMVQPVQPVPPKVHRSDGDPAPPASRSSGIRWPIIGSVAAVVVLLTGGIFVLGGSDDATGSPETSQVDSAPEPTLDGSTPPDTATVTPTTITTTTEPPPAPATPLVLPPGDPVQLEFLNPGIESEVMEQLIQGFAREQPDIDVTMVEADGYQTSLERLINGEIEPDIALLADRAVQSVLDQLDIVPVQDLIDQDDFDVTVLMPNAADMYSTADGLAAMPFNVAAPMVYANVDLLAEAGVSLAPGASLTTSELIDICRSLEGVVDTCIDLGLGRFVFTELVTNSGGRLFDTDGFDGSATAAAFDTSVGRRSFEFVAGLVSSGLAQRRSGARLLESGEAAFYATTSSSLDSVDVAIESSEDPVELIALGIPHLDGVSPTGVIPGGGALWMFDRGDERRAIASWLLLEYLLELPQLEVYHRASGYSPPRADAGSDDGFIEFWSQKPVFRGAFDEMVDASTKVLPNERDGRAGPFHEIDLAIEDRLRQAQDGELSTQDAFDALVADVNSLLVEYNESN